MKIRLFNIATLISGYSFREAIEFDSSGNVFVVQAKNILSGGHVDSVSDLTKTSFDIKDYSNYLQKNDVLIVSRGMKSGAFRATVFCAEEKNVIASSSVHIVRIKSQSVLPEYLTYYLNSNIGQTALSEYISGSYVGALSRKDLEKIEIPVVPIQKQKTIIDLQKNIAMQERLLERKKMICQNIPNSVFKNLITG